MLTPPRHNLNSKVPCKYRMMRLTALQCDGPALDMNWLTMLTANARSGRVATMAYINEPTPVLYGIPSISPSMASNSSNESFINFTFTSSGVPMGLQSSMLNRLSTSLIYFLWHMVMVRALRFLSNVTPRQYFNSPRSLIWNSPLSLALSHSNLA
ncbi:hypothetical protein KC19_4G059900 [Ceratodon purpureus]|uniref:Uncharacterized protein n=1 Tax=Ceratodon purpureus TaxID=3225 RepID=A0A8T0I788_CERPU|nr:hypothetical protein KC19_4G059900 [Ceratodon purpureus]